MAEAEAVETVTDRLLGGRLLLRQPARGHRAGSDAVLLAAALPRLGAGPLADLGAGVGTVGLIAALAEPDLRVTLVERDPVVAGLALENVGLNDLDARVSLVTVDLGAPAVALAAAGLATGRFACVAMNPPFFAPETSRPSPVALRERAHIAETPLATWFKAARRLLSPDGRLALIHRPEALGEILAELSIGFGAVAIRPIHGREERPAIRVVVTAMRGNRKPTALLRAFVLHDADGRFTPESEAVHRGEAKLPDA